MNKRVIIGILIIIGTILIAIFSNGLYLPSANGPLPEQNETQKQTDPNQPTLVSTTPSPLDKAILLPGQDIVLVFSHPLENIPELKYKFEPAIEGLQGTLSKDQKTVVFSFKKGVPVGQSYTLTIQQEAKFLEGKRLDKQYDFHFKTIDYKGV